MGSKRIVAFCAARRKNFHTVQNSFNELIRLLVLIALTFAAAMFGSVWVWALFVAVGWTLFVTVRENFRAV
jgi:hypothetical protein